MTAPAADRRTRKSTAEVRALLVDAGRAVFSEKGFAGATTREIAQRAGISETLLFRHFRSKAGLFDVAVIEPFASFVTGYAQNWTSTRDPHPAEAPAAEFFTGLYGMLREQRSVVLALLAAHHHEDGLDVDTDLSEVLDRLQSVVSHETAMRGWTGVDVPVATRTGFGMVLAGALFKEWFYRDPESMPDNRILDEMITMLIRGLAGRTASCHVDDTTTGRVVLSGADPATLLRTASDWIAAHGNRVDAISWQDGRLHIDHPGDAS